MSYKHKRKRRKEAIRNEKARSEVVKTQPGIIPQPGPFQTNEAWGEEMVAGPGPPKGWKSDKILEKIKQNMQKEGKGLRQGDNIMPQILANAPVQERTPNPPVSNNSQTADLKVTEASRLATQQQDVVQNLPHPSEVDAGNGIPLASSSMDSTPGQIPKADNTRDALSSTTSTSTDPIKTGSDSVSSRPTGARRLSNTFVAMKDTLITSLHPETWNWKRYEREDEVLWGFNERINRMWDRAKGHTSSGRGENQSSRSTSRKRAGTNGSDQYDYNRARHPEVNEMHPPVVSQLPSTREAAAWMLMAPPSRAVMEGKEKPNSEATMRWPLARIGTTKEEMEMRRKAMWTSERESLKLASTRPSSRGKERASRISDDPYAASDENSINDGKNIDDSEDKVDDPEERVEQPKKENVPHPCLAPSPFPHQHEMITSPAAAARLCSEPRKSWPNSTPSGLISDGDGSDSTSQRWSFGSIWVA
jgi:hypothetical protein